MNTETSVQTLAEIKKGSVIAGRYLIEGELGAGGFATVFSAFDREIERKVAIKVLNLAAMAGSQNDDVQPFLERFRREARLAARIRHGNVVEIYDFGVLGTQSNPYMVMEMLDGHDLHDELKRNGGMAPTRALTLFQGALEALGEAHQLGIVHKDLKPANLFINRPGSRAELLKVVDFGIAHIGESNESRMTQTGAMFGTPQYLPPEYIQTQVVTPSMDVYQMGLILVELLTGRSVVDEDNPWQCAVKHVTREFDIPVELLDGTLGPILRRALEYEPAERYKDAGQFSDALREVDPASIGDVRSPDTVYRKIDSASGQFVPNAGAGAAQDTDALSAPGFGDSPALPRPAGNLKTPLGQMQTQSPADDQTETIEQWEDEAEKSSNRKLSIILLLLIGTLVSIGITVAVLSGDSSDVAPQNASAEVTAAAEPARAPEVVPNPPSAIAADPGVDPADESGNAGLAAEQDEAPGAAPVATQEANEKTPQAAEDIVEKPEPAPPTPKKTPPTKPKPAPKVPSRPAPQAKVAPKAAPKPAPKAEPAPKAPSMLLAPDLDPNDRGMDLAP